MARVFVRPVLPQDDPILDAMDLEAEATVDWRFSGGIPSPQERLHRAWAGVLDRRVFVANTSRGPEIIGYGALYDHNPRGSNAWIAIVGSPNVRHSGWAFAAAGIYVARCFREWPLRTIYAQSRAANLTAFASVLDEGTAEPVATLRTGTEANAIQWIAIRREQWFASRDAFFTSFK